jgi:transposase-like protein
MPRQPPTKRPGTGKGGKTGQRRTRYTDAFRSAALTLLDANKGNITKTAAELDIPYRTLEAWKAGRRHPEARILQEQHKGDMAAATRAALWGVLDVIADPDKLRKANISQAATAADKLFTIMRTLDGAVSNITGNLSAVAHVDFTRLTDDELRQYLALTERIRTPDSGGAGGPVGVGPAILPRLRLPVLPAPESGPDPNTGLGDGNGIGSS